MSCPTCGCSLNGATDGESDCLEAAKIREVVRGTDVALAANRFRLIESLERARVVGVLDAWARADDERYWVSGPTYGGEGGYCTLWHVENKRVGGPFHAQTEDAARAAAAKAIENREV